MAIQSGSRIGSAILIVGLFIGGSLWVFGHTPAPTVRTMRLAASLPPGDTFGGPFAFPSVAISPDSRHIAYVASHDGVAQLYLRDLTEWNGKPLPGTVDAHTPFFSPDGQWLAAMIGTKLVKFPMAGGPPVAITNIPFKVYGGSWSSDGWIYMGTVPPLGLVKISLETGALLGASKVDDDHGETEHRYPDALPGGKWVLFAARKGGHAYDEAEICAISLKNGEVKSLIKGGTSPKYLSSGHLAFVREGKLMVVPFDPVSLQVKGEPVAAADGVLENPTVGAGQYAVSADGSLIFATGGAKLADRELVYIDRGGATKVLSSRKQQYEDLAISPDGRQLAVTIGGKTTDIWLHDMASGAEKVFTSGLEHRSPAWSGDGKRLFYSGYTGIEDQQWVMIQKDLDGDGKEHTLRFSETPLMPWFISRDGQILLYEESSRSGNALSELMWMDGSHRFQNMTLHDFNQEWSQFSADGHWLAYNIDESGQQEVYVVPYPALVPKVKISTGGGTHPFWSTDGKELYYLSAPAADAGRPLDQRVRLMAVPMETSPALKPGTPHMLFAGPFYQGGHDYVMTPDGKGFIFIRESQPVPASAELRMIVNWAGDLSQHLPRR